MAVMMVSPVFAKEFIPEDEVDEDKPPSQELVVRDEDTDDDNRATPTGGWDIKRAQDDVDV